MGFLNTQVEGNLEAPGILYVVATPIGNLEDITRRAERVLSEVDVIACEDTRRTRKLLSHLGIKKRLTSYYEPKEEKALPGIIKLLEDGRDVALVTDGGTPAVSDPGYRLARAAHEAGITVTPVPGPSALTAALSAAGLPTDRVTFIGFPPARKGARTKILEELKNRPDTLVFYESPRRLTKFLKEASDVLGDREAVVFREITKLHEEQIRGNISEIIDQCQSKDTKGEITVLIRGATTKTEFSENEIRGLIMRKLEKGEKPVSEMAAEIARESGWTRKDVYSLALKIKKPDPQ
jgi:16S rRNA (cytidine1402-2'-O)-methyltransferase